MYSSVLLVSFSVLFPVFQLTKSTVVLAYNGKEKIVETHSKTIGDVLKEEKIKLRKEDKISPSLNTKIHDNMTIKLDLAKKVTISINNKEKKVWTTADTVGELAQEQKIDLNGADQVKPGINEEIRKGMKIIIKKAVPIKYTDRDLNTEVWTTSATVADFLKDNHVVLGKMDRIEPKKETVLTPYMSIKVTRVEKATDVVEEPIDFKTITRKDSSLPAGTEKVIQEGEKGLIKKHFELTKENGNDVAKKMIKKEIVKEPKSRIVAVGTKPVSQEVFSEPENISQPISIEPEPFAAQISSESPQNEEQVSSEIPQNSVKEFYVTATAYTSSCSGCSGITKTGYNLKENPDAKVIAVDPRVIPLGSKVWVEGYGYAIAADTGGAIKGKRIDVFLANESDALNFGRKTVLVKVLQ